MGGSFLWQGASCGRELAPDSCCGRELAADSCCGRELAPDSLAALHRPKPCWTNDGYPLINAQIQQVPSYRDQQFCRAC